MVELKNILEKRGFKVFNDKREHEWWLEKQDPRFSNQTIKVRIAFTGKEWTTEGKTYNEILFKEYGTKNEIIKVLKDDKNFKI